MATCTSTSSARQWDAPPPNRYFLHPDVGELVLHFESPAIAGAPGQHLSVYSAEPDSPTADALAELSALTSVSA